VDLSIGAEVEKLRKAVVRRAGALGGLDELWGEVVPGELASLTRPVKLTVGGVLTVKGTDSSAVWAFDQWIRSGGLAVLRGACTATLRSVKAGVR
jgi:hypothetical protein